MSQTTREMNARLVQNESDIAEMIALQPTDTGPTHLPTSDLPPPLENPRPCLPSMTELMGRELPLPLVQGPIVLPTPMPTPMALASTLSRLTNTTLSNEDHLDLLKQQLKFLQLDNARHETTLDSINRKIKAVDGDIGYVAWQTDCTQNAIRESQQRVASLRQRYDDLLQQIISRGNENEPNEAISRDAPNQPT